MSKVFKTVGTIAGVVAGVALIGTGIGAALGGTMILASIGTASSIAAVAGTISALASTAAQLTMKKPPMAGTVSQVVIQSNSPMPYTIGRTYLGGHMAHDRGYGAEVDDVKNPYRSIVLVWSGAGPVEEIEAFQSDFTTITFDATAGGTPLGEATGYYADYMWLDSQLGLLPEADALAGPFGAIPKWGVGYKLSGYAAGLVTMKFHKKGKRYGSGVPQFGAILKGVLAYDPRLDDTYPGGAGTHRFDDESTWEWSENPALHAIAYARGRYQNSKKVFGCGFSEESIDLAAFVAWANVCDANSWTIGGVVYEPSSKWDNLKRICIAGAAEPVFIGAKLTVKYESPKVSLDTITADDLADGEINVPAMKSWRERRNGIIPRYRSENHKWEYVQSALVSIPGYVTEDGEEKNEEVQYDLIQDKDQAAAIAAYELARGREKGPIVLPCKPRMLGYLIGEALTVDIPEANLEEQLCVITGRRFDPSTGIVELVLESETDDKHDFALSQIGTEPAAIDVQSGEDLDEIAESASARAKPYSVASEAAQLALPATLGDVAIRTDINKTFTHNGGTSGTMADWAEELSTANIADGDKGDITVSGSGATWTIDNDAVTNAKSANMAQATIKGRQSGAGTGDPEDLTATQARTAMGLGTAALKNTGQSGDALPIANGGATTWSGDANFNTYATIGKHVASAYGRVELSGTFPYYVWAPSGWGSQAYIQAGLNDALSGAGDNWFFNNPSGKHWVFSEAGTFRLKLSNAGAFYLPGIGTTANAANAYFDNGSSPANQLLRSTSSIRYKKDITDVTPSEARDIINKLRGIRYRSKAEADDPLLWFYGLVAEEVAEVDPRLVHWSYFPEDYDQRFSGLKPLKASAVRRPDGVMYDRIAVLLLISVQDILSRVSVLEEKARLA